MRDTNYEKKSIKTPASGKGHSFSNISTATTDTSANRNKIIINSNA
jgi:hypothetical protein